MNNIIEAAVAVSAIIYPPIMLWLAIHNMDEAKKRELLNKIQFVKWFASLLLGCAISITAFWLELQSDVSFDKVQASKMIGIAIFFTFWILGHVIYLIIKLVFAHHEIIGKHLNITKNSVKSLDDIASIMDKQNG